MLKFIFTHYQSDNKITFVYLTKRDPIIKLIVLKIIRKTISARNLNLPLFPIYWSVTWPLHPSRSYLQKIELKINGILFFLCFKEIKILLEVTKKKHHFCFVGSFLSAYLVSTYLRGWGLIIVAIIINVL